MAIREKHTSLTPEQREKRKQNSLKALGGISSKLNTELAKSGGGLPGDKNFIEFCRYESVPTTPSGSLVLDVALGGGLAIGRIIHVFGPESSGKTSMAMSAISTVQKEGGVGVIFDLENALDPVYVSSLGVDTDELLVVRPRTTEETLNTMMKIIQSNSVDLIVVDSVAAMVPQAVMDKGAGENTMAENARLLSTSLPKVAALAEQYETTVIFINQLREKVGFFLGNPETTPGGKALLFYASQAIEVRRDSKRAKDANGNEYSNIVKLKVKKNKIAPPTSADEKIVTRLTFSRGIDRSYEVARLGMKFGVLVRSGSGPLRRADTDEKLASSEDTLVTYLDEHPEVRDDLMSQIREKIDSNRNARIAHEEERFAEDTSVDGDEVDESIDNDEDDDFTSVAEDEEDHNTDDVI